MKITFFYLSFVAIVAELSHARPLRRRDLDSTSQGNATTSPSNSLVRRAANTTQYWTCKEPGSFAVTFDDGPQPNEAAFVNLLNQATVTGTFFVNGYNWDCIYDEDIVQTLRATYAAGHQIGIHTWGHTHSADLTQEQFSNQLILLEDALVKILGVLPAFYRPPYGEISDSNIAVLASRNYSAAIQWDDVSGPATGTSVQASNAMYAGKAATYPSPHLILDHEQDDVAITQIIPQALAELQRAGYKLVSVSECLDIPPYQWIGQPQARDSSWTCDGKPLPGAAE
ncbi:MAG: Carbohydrate esterase 4 protein [Cyphobasidiales sp. Tagirdzhanova-0007]|nr:MAG: Carbohydrate esterase 4 protein [Cyphobasidiales sp. Tagirdzhanova-0007]